MRQPPAENAFESPPGHNTALGVEVYWRNVLAPAVGKFSINLIADHCYARVACPGGESLHISAVEHTPGRVTRRVHDQDARVCTFFSRVSQRLGKRLWGQAMVIMSVCFHRDHSPARQPGLWCIADPGRNR